MKNGGVKVKERHIDLPTKLSESGRDRIVQNSPSITEKLPQNEVCLLLNHTSSVNARKHLGAVPRCFGGDILPRKGEIKLGSPPPIAEHQ